MFLTFDDSTSYHDFILLKLDKRNKFADREIQVTLMILLPSNGQNDELFLRTDLHAFSFMKWSPYFPNLKFKVTMHFPLMLS